MTLAAFVLPAALASAPLAARVAAPSETECTEQRCGHVLGRVQAKGERKPVGGARVVVVPDGTPEGTVPPWSRGTETGADGRFSVGEVPAGALRIIVLREGFSRLEHTTQLPPGANVGVELYLPRDVDHAYRTVVVAPTRVQEGKPASTVLSREEIRTLPGTQGDALRALQDLPGVARPPGGLGLLVIRGAPPWQSLTLLGEHPVPRAFHSLPFAGIVQSDALDDIEMVPSNASARYGPVAGGVVRLSPRRPRTDAVHGHGTVDLTGAQAEVDGPVGRASYLVAARRGYVDGVLRLVERIDPTQSFMLPGFWDYQAWIIVPWRRAEVEVRALGAGDRVRNRQRQYDSGERINVFEFRSQFHRFDLVGRWKTDKIRILATPTVRIQRDRATTRGQLDVTRREVAPGWRAEIEARVAARARLVVGADGEVAPYVARIEDEGRPDEEPTVTEFRDVQSRMAAYGLVHFGTDRWRITPSTRLQAFSIGDRRAVALDPRLDVELAIGERVTLQAGLGHYSLPRIALASASGNLVSTTVREFAPTAQLPPALIASFEPQVPLNRGAVGLRVFVADQAAAGIRTQWPGAIDVDVTGFVRRTVDPGVQETAVTPNVGETRLTIQRQVGLDYGGELLVRKRVTGNFYGWIAYTLMRSIVGIGRFERPSSFDQPHNLLAVLSYALPRRIRLGARFRLASGNPYQPIVGVVDKQTLGSPEYRPLYGAPNSARFPLFHQLDLRVDKQWALARATISAYLDIQNVYNRANVEAWVYHVAFRGRRGAVGLPIFPTLGGRVEF